MEKSAADSLAKSIKHGVQMQGNQGAPKVCYEVLQPGGVSDPKVEMSSATWETAAILAKCGENADPWLWIFRRL